MRVARRRAAVLALALSLLAVFVLAPLTAALGAAVAPGEKWQRVDSPRLSVGVSAARGGGAAVRVSLRF